MIERLCATYADQMAHVHAGAFEQSWSAKDFATHTGNATDDVLGWVEEGYVLGFIILRTLGDQSEIITIAVSQDQQRRGIGAYLLRVAEEQIAMRGADIVFLEVAKDTPAAIRLYQRTGYQGCGTRRGYYRRAKGRVDALLFSKKIDPKISD